ncbi:archease [Nonomuraea sp. NPDC050451]|uniref:archease n=1 Tax=Nonomuraea sp. NPDC050451 TaxID=3364364 RepID=UPI00378E7E18
MVRGHRAVLRVADVAVEAWADGREECLAEAVQALVECCVRVGDAVPDACVMFALVEESDEALLVAVLDEVIRQIEANGRVTVDVSVDERTVATRGQVEVRLATVLSRPSSAWPRRLRRSRCTACGSDAWTVCGAPACNWTSNVRCFSSRTMYREVRSICGPFGPGGPSGAWTRGRPSCS